MASVVVFLYVAKVISGPLSNIESGIFAIALSVATTAISIIASLAISNLTLESQLKTYGKSAMRRIVQSLKGCKAILQTIGLKKSTIDKDGLPTKEVISEFLDNIYGQVDRIMSTIFDSKDDWTDILKEESKEAVALNLEFGELLFKQIKTQNELDKIKKEAEDVKGDKAKVDEKIKHMEKELKKTQEELTIKKKEIAEKSASWPFSNAGFSGPTGPLVSLSSSLLGVSGYSGLNDVAYLAQCADCGSFLAGTQLQCVSCSKPLCFSCSSTKQWRTMGADSLNMGPKCNECLKKTT